MKLSIVTTLYESERYVEEFYERTRASALKLTSDHEFVFVNDGSSDASLEAALHLQERDWRVRVIDLSRNFGHHRAMMTGLGHARGDLVFLIDCDLEEEPEWLIPFHEELTRSKSDVVFGVQGARKGSLFERVSGSLFFWVFNHLSEYPIPRNVLTVRLMTRRYLTALLRHRERVMTISGLWTITGFAQRPQVVKKLSRSDTSYSIGRKIAHAINSITSFSDRPLVAIFYLGALILLLSSTAALYLIVRRVVFGVLLAGWPSLIVSVWLLGGLTLFALGIIGIYLSRVFLETKKRPLTVVRQRFEREGPGSDREAVTP
jgi:putative glycosyltransferase